MIEHLLSKENGVNSILFVLLLSKKGTGTFFWSPPSIGGSTYHPALSDGFHTFPHQEIP